MIKCISEVKKKQKQDIISDMNRLSKKQELLRLNCKKRTIWKMQKMQVQVMIVFFKKIRNVTN